MVKSGAGNGRGDLITDPGRLCYIRLMIWLFLLAAAASALLSGGFRRFPGRLMQDVPNERSSHDTPTPRGGGLAVWLVFTVGIVALAATDRMDISTAVAFAGSGTLAALIGLLDDLKGVRPVLRLTGHAVAVVWGMVWLGGFGPLSVGSYVVEWGWAGEIIVAAGLVWLINLYNFMDGIDGLASAEGVFIAGVGAGLAMLSGESATAAAALLLAAAIAGFLPWNWPRARFFLGDSGSGFLGVSLGLLAVSSHGGGSGGGVPVWCWMILAAVFLSDATVTLAVRMARGESPTQAHRTHAYQILSRRWRSHGRTTAAITLFNLLVLCPLALAAWRWPAAGAGIAVVSIAVVGGIAAIIGAGRSRQTP